MKKKQKNIITHWGKDVLKELQKRSKTFGGGTAKTYTWEETKTAAINKFKIPNPTLQTRG